MPRTFKVLLCAGALTSCFERTPPPGAEREPSRGTVVSAPASGAAYVPGPDAATLSGEVREDVLGTMEDNLPFVPQDTKLASIAWRTWVYTDTGPKRTRLGYLRAGAVVDARGPELKNEGCAGGWWRINPRGFVCIGKGATLDVKHYAVVANSVRPQRGEGLPYLYAMASEMPPHRYFKLPTLEQMVKVEGEGIKQRFASWSLGLPRLGYEQLLDDPQGPPAFVNPEDALVKPYGVKEHLHYSVHSGMASPDSGFAISRVFEWEGRLFGLTTELDLIPLDRTRLVRPSAFRGVELGDGEDLPVAFMKEHASRFELRNREYVPTGRFGDREGVKLRGTTQAGGLQFQETTSGEWIVPVTAMRVVKKRDSFPSFATGDRKWIDISIKHQTLVAYQGTKPVYATLISSGRGGMGDPEKVFATVRGTFMIHSKHVTATMDGDEDKSDSFNLLDVPFVQYFHKGYALHGTYWHDEYGELRSHGCVNLSPLDSAWLFEWTDPVVPSDWHSRLNKDRGTVVYIHY